jgi:putative ABC transport system permease protein
MLSSVKSRFRMLRVFFRRPQLEERLHDELQMHVEMLAEKNVRLGMSPGEAQRQARIAVGGFSQMREAVRDARGFRWLDELARDVRYARHILWRQKALSLMVIALLAVASAANTAIFSVHNLLHLRALPLPHAERLVNIDAAGIFARPEENRSFEAFGFYNPDSLNYSSRGSASTASVLNVTWNFASVFEIRPVIGRGFLEKEDRPGEPKVAMLGYRFWQREFGGRPSALGETVKLNGEPHTVVGVLPENADFPQTADLWVLYQLDPYGDGGWFPRGMGRLKETVTLARARADMARINGLLNATRPANGIVSAPKLTPLREAIFGTMSVTTTLLLPAAGILLLIVCCNVTAMMLARAEYRIPEMGIRAALGAAPAAIVRQLLTESLALAIPGVLIGLLAGQIILKIMALETEAPSWVRLTPDLRMLAFCVLLAGVATILFGLAPALQAARVEVQPSLYDAGVRASVGRSKRRGLKILVTAEVALAVVMLVESGLLLRAWQKTLAVDPGFRAGNVIIFNIKLPPSTYRNLSDSERFYDRFLANLRQLPGVTTASGSNVLPLGGATNEVLVEVQGIPPAPPDRPEPILLRWVFPDYFRTLDIPLLAGRDFNDRDGATIDTSAAIVDQSFARRYWPGMNPIGKRIRMTKQSYGRWWGPMPGLDQWMTVVGVTRDTLHYGLDQAVQPGIYIPHKMWKSSQMYVMVRSSLPSAAVLGPIRAELHAINPDLGMFGVSTMTEVVNRSMTFRRMVATIMTLFAATALLIAAAGVYGVVSYDVSRRTHEIGIRVALGATRRHVLGLVAGEGAGLVIAGAALGIVGAIVASRATTAMLFGVTPFDVPTYLFVCAVLLGTVLAATLLPARRAAGIEPMRALRSE